MTKWIRFFLKKKNLKEYKAKNDNLHDDLTFAN